MLSYICVKQDFTAGWLPGILWMAIFYKKAFHFSHVSFKRKLLIWAGPIAYFGWPLFKFWLKVCLCMNQQILHIWYQSPNFMLESCTCIILFIIISISDLWNQTADSEVTFEINSHLSNRSYIYSSCCVTKTVYPWLKGTKCPRM